MIIFPEISFFLSTFDWITLTGLAVGLPVLGFAVVNNGNKSGCGCGCGHNPPDEQAIKISNRVTELERIAARTIEQNEELSELYIEQAIQEFETGVVLDDALQIFDKAAAVLQTTLLQGEDDEIRRRLGNVYLHRAVAYNDYEEYESAISSYVQAIEILKPLENKGDGEAKYDIAGIRLNRGVIYHDLGDFENAKTDFDESFMAFRAVEKISDLDTRYYMAKVSVAQGDLFRDMNEPLEKSVDAYNRAMRLFVELIDIGQMEFERELANTLIRRCSVTYDEYTDREFDSPTERLNKFGDVLIDVGRGIEILKKLAQNNDFENRFDLFNAQTMEGSILLDLGKNQEAYQIFDEMVRDFADFEENEDIFVVNQYASAMENRGVAAINLDRTKEAIADFNKIIEMRRKFLDENYGLDDDSRFIFQPSLATSIANLANAYAILGDMERAKKEGEIGLKLIRDLKKTNDFDDELDEIEQIFESLLEQWK